MPYNHSSISQPIIIFASIPSVMNTTAAPIISLAFLFLAIPTTNPKLDVDMAYLKYGFQLDKQSIREWVLRDLATRSVPAFPNLKPHTDNSEDAAERCV